MVKWIILIFIIFIFSGCEKKEELTHDVISTNVNKLLKRYPGGEFDVFYSENRAADDR